MSKFRIDGNELILLDKESRQVAKCNKLSNGDEVIDINKIINEMKGITNDNSDNSNSISSSSSQTTTSSSSISSGNNNNGQPQQSSSSLSTSTNPITSSTVTSTSTSTTPSPSSITPTTSFITPFGVSTISLEGNYSVSNLLSTP